MTDELDPQLARWFAAAEQSLADAEFAARVAARVTARVTALHRRRWSPSAALRISTLVWRGLMSAVAVALRRRPALTGLAAIFALALSIGLALQG